jgi:hypothetical protein
VAVAKASIGIRFQAAPFYSSTLVPSTVVQDIGCGMCAALRGITCSGDLMERVQRWHNSSVRLPGNCEGERPV